MTAAGLDRRFANFRLGLAREPLAAYVPDVRDASHRSRIGAERLAATLDGELIRTERGAFVRLEAPSTILPLDRGRLATLPGQPPASVPLLCLDTETTGLATAAGTLAFLVGLGWWEGGRFRQVQLLLPDHADEPALLGELARHVPPGGWLVTYNGRGFDWPLIVARYRLARDRPPNHAGHLDLLPVVRRLFRHRMVDARLATVEAALLGVRRHADVAGWEIPERYFTFLRDGEPGPLVDVVRHNDEDVRSLARLLGHLDRDYADRSRWSGVPPGDLAGLSRAFAREGRHAEALACLDASLDRLAGQDRPAGRDARAEGAIGAAIREASPGGAGDALRRSVARHEEPWWSTRRRPDFGGRPDRYARPDSWPAADPVRRDAAWSAARVAAERARLLRRLGRHRDAEQAWLALTVGGGTLAVLAWIEVAKAREHRLDDVEGALAAALLAMRTAERQRGLGRPLPRLELAIARRSVRLRSRLARRQPERRRVARRSTDARSGTPNRPGASTVSEPAAAASRRSSPPPRGPPRRRRSTLAASSVARKTSPAPVASTTESGGIAR
ncbi:MAG TPA: ribonuclease H-like domain-containing protein [Candidatus Limnocylindrales bacterium]|nr:ribonuclease H-like domain-containing protein [Candidatus Limnocylindrales bacterium]